MSMSDTVSSSAKVIVSAQNAATSSQLRKPSQPNPTTLVPVTLAGTKCSVVLADSELLVRSGIKRMLESTPGFEVVGEAADSDAALKLVLEHRPTLLITEINFSGFSGLELVLELSRRKLDTKVILLSRVESPALVQRAYQAGAWGFVSKSSTPEDFLAALDAATKGECRAASAIDSKVSGQLNGESGDPLSALSPREREIFHHLASGLQNSVIAKKLFISPRTVETHRARIVRKLGLSSNAELIRFSIKHGLSVL